uniref:hypothetical protein n=1 Tax=Flavobacterium sp. TaxID=239 RepID=UPI00374D6708
MIFLEKGQRNRGAKRQSIKVTKVFSLRLSERIKNNYNLKLVAHFCLLSEVEEHNNFPHSLSSRGTRD